MQDQDERGAGRAIQPVEVEKVPVGSDDPLAPQREAATAHERAPEGLEVPVAAPPGWVETYS
jgi:hypothetical protein